MSGPTKKDRLINKAKSLNLLVDRSMTSGQIERLISMRLPVAEVAERQTRRT